MSSSVKINKHINITVSGKVQGVFFRQSTVDVARQLMLKGFVRNEADGTVYVEAEGNVEQLGKLIEWCRKGPPRASVTDVHVTDGEMKNFSWFEIRR